MHNEIILNIAKTTGGLDSSSGFGNPHKKEKCN